MFVSVYLVHVEHIHSNLKIVMQHLTKNLPVVSQNVDGY